MKKLYSVALMAVFAFCNAEPSSELPPGKLPEDFSFKKCEEDDVECLEARTSFMKQWNSYQKNGAQARVTQTSGKVTLMIQGIVLNIDANPHEYSIMTETDGNITNVNILNKR